MSREQERWWVVAAHVTLVDPTQSPTDDNRDVIDPLERLNAWAEVRGGTSLAYTDPSRPGVWSFQFDPGPNGPQAPHPDIEAAWIEEVRQALTPQLDIISISSTWDEVDPLAP